MPKIESSESLSIGFILAPRFTLMALAGFVEALRHAADLKDRNRQIHCRWSILASDQRGVKSSCGITITPTNRFHEDVSYDYVAIVGGLLSGHDEIGGETLRYLRELADRGIPLIGLCTGSFILARAGLMDGRRCCVGHYHADDFKAGFPNRDIDVVADSLFVVDGPRITCAGGLSAVDLAVYLVERHLGPQRAQKSVAQMISDGVRPPSAPQPPIGLGWDIPATQPLSLQGGRC